MGFRAQERPIYLNKPASPIVSLAKIRLYPKRLKATEKSKDSATRLES